MLPSIHFTVYAHYLTSSGGGGGGGG
ncbi:MAG: hypothetical protein RLZZ387_4269, partial [Chloroflexota bacterium]